MLYDAEERLTDLCVQGRVYAFQTLGDLFEVEEPPLTGTFRNDHCLRWKALAQLLDADRRPMISPPLASKRFFSLPLVIRVQMETEGNDPACPPLTEFVDELFPLSWGTSSEVLQTLEELIGFALVEVKDHPLDDLLIVLEW